MSDDRIRGHVANRRRAAIYDETADGRRDLRYKRCMATITKGRRRCRNYVTNEEATERGGYYCMKHKGVPQKLVGDIKRVRSYQQEMRAKYDPGCLVEDDE